MIGRSCKIHGFPVDLPSSQAIDSDPRKFCRHGKFAPDTDTLQLKRPEDETAGNPGKQWETAGGSLRYGCGSKPMIFHEYEISIHIIRYLYMIHHEQRKYEPPPFLPIVFSVNTRGSPAFGPFAAAVYRCP